jgi:hypothetical protein
MLTSKAYQLPAVDQGEAAARDFVFKGPAIRRLSAEEFRDVIAQLTGVWYDKSEVPGMTNQVRACLVAADPLTTGLGRPNREQVCTMRPATATTLQALELTNGETLAKVLQKGAEQLAADSPEGDELVSRLYHLALGRAPTSTELEVATELVGKRPTRESIEDLLWATSMLPEFQLIY